ncbi:transcriptional regulator starvation/low temperature inducible DNA-binding protein [Acetobacter estunensis NRIC 0472]|uniref:DNA starvation/stationary phase protection protein n=1 Tax=Acetobacter estunensis TaxID=104097 RepID=A0A967EH31_9PROT|nr:DNA starvation/stationary phase protection protein [Acetobacter estunensis]MBV1838197.1 DNA starvation/stationary phase protection protein [Acetobacter estunensis]NHO53107.1 DNA starvation/stationary phase protection protein [Acetobacter estunensis]GBQ24721.1 transcriptional regulator starvation/low temperature inducible DNA-binding protein [Acetobacter estunensis NRIC 0472]
MSTTKTTDKTKAKAAYAAEVQHFLGTPSDLPREGVEQISAGLRALLADVFALYLKTKNFHWHMSGRHFRDLHLMLDDQSAELFAMTDPVAERARRIGGLTLHSIGEISTHQRIKDNNAEYVDAPDMIAELCEDNKQLVASMRSLHGLTSDVGDCATTSLLENWIDQSEKRTWFLFEITRTTFGANS